MLPLEHDLGLRNHIIARLPDRLITDACKLKSLKGLQTNQIEKPDIDIFFHEHFFVNLRVVDYKDRKMITNKKPIYLEYDTIACWLLSMSAQAIK